MVANDTEIIAKIKCGDRKAYESLFLEHYKNMVWYAKKFVLETEVARDIVQDVFIYIWEKRQKLHIDRSASSYLFRAVKNASMNYLKREDYKEDYIRNFLLSINSESSEQDDVHEMVVHNDLLVRIEAIIESLPEQCKNMFRMSRFRGLKNREIATIYSVSPRTVETQIYRALKVLKENLPTYMTSACILSLLLGKNIWLL